MKKRIGKVRQARRIGIKEAATGPKLDVANSIIHGASGGGEE